MELECKTIEIECQNCNVHIGECPADLSAMYEFCPYCGVRILPHVIEGEHES